MSSGLPNAPGTSQRTTNVILFSLKRHHALVYLYGVFDFSKTLAKHIENVRSFLTRVRDADVTLELKKGWFFTSSVNYLGHVTRARGLEIASHTPDAVSDLKTPTAVTDPESVLGLCNVFRRFVPGFVCVAAPLNKKL